MQEECLGMNKKVFALAVCTGGPLVRSEPFVGIFPDETPCWQKL